MGGRLPLPAPANKARSQTDDGYVSPGKGHDWSRGCVSVPCVEGLRAD
jgi:hypothetical protein